MNDHHAGTPHDLNQDRLWELLADEALGELAHEDSAELARLKAAAKSTDLDSIARIVAEFDVARHQQRPEAAPNAAIERVRAQGKSFTFQTSSESSSASPAVAGAKLNGREVIAWILAIAASCIAVASLVPAKRAELSLAAQREQLIEKAGKSDALIRKVWETTPETVNDGIGGDIAWDAASQQGFMRIKGLAANDPKKNQYQLWIFDEAQKNPIDGGVFDIDKSGEVIVPIHAKLQVVKPTLFAVTVEKPGGVVVSDREHIVLLAKVD